MKTISLKNQKENIVWLEEKHAERLREQFEETAEYRGWTILAGAILRNHVHLVVGVKGNPEPDTLLRDFKSYGSRALNSLVGEDEKRSWWTRHGSMRKVKDASHLVNVLRYVECQERPLVVWFESDEGLAG